MGLLGLLLAILSVIALVSPKTPFGVSFRRLSFLSNENFERYHRFYRTGFYLVSLTLVIFLFYLILIDLSFFTTQTYIFNFLYMGCFIFSLMAIIGRKSFRKLSFQIFIRFLIPLLVFISLLGVLHTFLENSFNNGKLDSIYQSFTHEQRFTNIPDSLNATELRDYLGHVYKINAGLFILKEYQDFKEFEIDLSADSVDIKKPYASVLQKCKTLYNSGIFSKSFLEKVDSRVESFNNPIFRKTNVTPPEIQPNYVSSYLILKYSKRFSTLALGTKILLKSYYLKLINNLGLLGFCILFPSFILISSLGTIKLNSYNKKFDSEASDSHNLFFMFVSVFGLFITILSFM